MFSLTPQRILAKLPLSITFRPVLFATKARASARLLKRICISIPFSYSTIRRKFSQPNQAGELVRHKFHTVREVFASLAILLIALATCCASRYTEKTSPSNCGKLSCVGSTCRTYFPFIPLTQATFALAINHPRAIISAFFFCEPCARNPTA